MGYSCVEQITRNKFKFWSYKELHSNFKQTKEIKIFVSLYFLNKETNISWQIFVSNISWQYFQISLNNLKNISMCTGRSTIIGPISVAN